MICDPEHRRRSIRLKGHDYAQPGAYFVTICTRNWERLFGEAAAGSIVLNPMDQVVEEEWLRTAEIRPNVELDAFVIMPNHVHGIVMIIDHGRGVLQYAPTPPRFVSPSQTVGAIIRGFKSATAKHINRVRGTPRRPVWQRNYYEHIIRNDKGLNRIRQYIVDNPRQWHLDRYNPDASGADEFYRWLGGM